MELKAKLNKPYTDKEKLDFIVKYNHKSGYEIKETPQGLKALGLTSEEINKQEKERILKLSLTRADVERALYKARKIDFDDVIELVKDNPEIDLKALKIELKANNFFRGNIYIEKIGALLGYSSDDLDYLFKNRQLPEKEEMSTTEENSEVVKENLNT